MTTHDLKAPIEVHSAGEAASAALSAGRSGTVLASVTDTVYLQNQSGELYWLIPMDVPMHQRAIKINGLVPRFRRGAMYEVIDHGLAIDSENILNFRHSHIWKEPFISVKDIIPVSTISGSLIYIANRLFNQYNPSGFGCLIKPILELAIQQENALSPCFENRIVEKAWPEIKGMILASLNSYNEHFLLHAESLVGMGQGLTPSGDDFLGGFFFSLKLLKDNYDLPVNLPTCNHTDLILHWSDLTNWLSYSILVDNIEGHSVDPLFNLVTGILLGTPIDQLVLHAKRLVRLGHSTGWDMLAGFFAGMSTMIGQ